MIKASNAKMLDTLDRRDSGMSSSTQSTASQENVAATKPSIITPGA